MNNNAIPMTGMRRIAAWRPLAGASGWVLLVLCFSLVVGCKKAAPTTTSSPAGQAPIAQAPAEGGGRNAIVQLPFDQAAKLVLMNIGRAYQMASISNGKPPKNAAELDAGKMKTLRDMQEREIEVVYGVNLAKLGDEAANLALAWEKTATNDGCRMVLMADLTTVKYVSQAEFDQMKRAK